MTKNILNDIKSIVGTIIADGATGTNYFSKGLETGDPPELWNILKPEYVSSLHKEFIEAGSNIILTNSFGGTSCRLKLHNEEKNVYSINKKAAQIAKDAALKFRTDQHCEILVAGSVGPTGELFEPLGELTIQKGTEIFYEQAKALKDGGADLLWIETLSSLDEVDAALNGAEKAGINSAITMSFDTAKRSMMGVTPQDFVNHVCGRSYKPIAIGANCGVGPAELIVSLKELKSALPEDILLIAKGNCGIPEFFNDEIIYKGTTQLMAKYAILSRDAGADIIGGCCGTTSEHIKAIRDAVDTENALFAWPSIPFHKNTKVSFNRIKDELGIPWKNLDDQNENLGRVKRKRRLKR